MGKCALDEMGGKGAWEEDDDDDGAREGGNEQEDVADADVLDAGGGWENWRAPFGFFSRAWWVCGLVALSRSRPSSPSVGAPGCRAVGFTPWHARPSGAPGGTSFFVLRSSFPSVPSSLVSLSSPSVFSPFLALALTVPRLCAASYRREWGTSVTGLSVPALLLPLFSCALNGAPGLERLLPYRI